MTTIQFVYLYFITIPIFLIIDLLWLGVLAKDFYQTQLGSFFGPINWTAVLIFYFLNIVGILIFVVAPALEAGSLQKAILYGALFGLFTYATYDLTNLATLKDWPVVVVVVDIIWGMVLTSSVATLSFLIGKSLFL